MNKVDPRFRSRMNVCFTIGAPAEPLTAEAAAARSPVNRALEQRFSQEAEAAGLLQLTGHPLFGGLRVTLYNTMPDTAIRAAAEFTARFAEENAHLVERDATAAMQMVKSAYSEGSEDAPRRIMSSFG